MRIACIDSCDWTVNQIRTDFGLQLAVEMVSCMVFMLCVYMADLCVVHSLRTALRVTILRAATVW